jgi:hypothetical protein
MSIWLVLHCGQDVLAAGAAGVALGDGEMTPRLAAGGLADPPDPAEPGWLVQPTSTSAPPATAPITIGRQCIVLASPRSSATNIDVAGPLPLLHRSDT